MTHTRASKHAHALVRNAHDTCTCTLTHVTCTHAHAGICVHGQYKIVHVLGADAGVLRWYGRGLSVYGAHIHISNIYTKVILTERL